MASGYIWEAIIKLPDDVAQPTYYQCVPPDGVGYVTISTLVTKSTQQCNYAQVLRQMYTTLAS